MQCNIDARGKAVRLVMGIALALVGGGLIVLTAIGVLAGVWAWVIGLALLAGGSFAIFEARNGWCALRAMGWRTPL